MGKRETDSLLAWRERAGRSFGGETKHDDMKKLAGGKPGELFAVIE
jgi:hypothetical protein